MTPPELRITDEEAAEAKRGPRCERCRGRGGWIRAGGFEPCDECGDDGYLNIDNLPPHATTRLGAWLVEALPHLRRATWPPVRHKASRAEIRAMVGFIAGMGGAR